MTHSVPSPKSGQACACGSRTYYRPEMSRLDCCRKCGRVRGESQTCTAREQENMNDALGVGEFLRATLSALVNSRWEVCKASATWATPLGPRCDAHAETLFAAASQPDTLLSVLLLTREQMGQPVDRDAMRKNSRRYVPDHLKPGAMK